MSFTARILEYLVLSILIAPLSLKFAGMDKKGSLATFFIGLVVYVSLGFYGFLVLLSLHVIGSIVTRAGYDTKMKRGIAQKKRSLQNVLANGFFASLGAFLSAVFSSYNPLFFVAYVSSVAAATADTVSSEIGELSNTRPRLITTFEDVDTGTDGAVSSLGTVSGIWAALLIGLIAAFFNPTLVPIFQLLVLATFSGFIGTTVDSILGATLERKGNIGNEFVNLASTGTAFVVSSILYIVFV